MRRTLNILMALGIAALLVVPSAYATRDDSKHVAKTLEKVVDRCQADRAKAKDADRLAEARAECTAELSAFFSENSPTDLPDEIVTKLSDLLSSGYVSLFPEQFGWDLKHCTCA